MRRPAPGPVWRALACAAVLSGLCLAAGGVAAAQPAGPGRGQLAAPFDDGARSIYGLSGTFAAPCAETLCQGVISIAKVASLGSSYLRLSVNLNCPGAVPQAPQPTRGNAGTLGDILRATAAAAVIPVVDVVPRDDCPDGLPLTPDDWRAQLDYFAKALHARHWYPPSRWIYFEIGNEPNLTPERYGASYAADFRAAAQGLQAALGPAAPYRVLTAGMLQPTALPTCMIGRPYPDTRPTYTNLDMAAEAISRAEASPGAVPSRHLGVSVHPYKYNTPEVASYWRNYYYWGNGYAGSCYDLRNLLQTWTAAFPDLPIFLSESNWSDQPTAARHCTNYVACEGTYLVDLFTWLHHHGYDDPRTSPLRVLYFRGADADLSLGLYGYRGNDKPFWTGYCPLDTAAAGWKALGGVFAALIGSPCY
jgi:hypothetical protein